MKNYKEKGTLLQLLTNNSYKQSSYFGLNTEM